MVDRILLGAFPDGGYGCRISKPGYDVKTNPVDNEQLIFSSDWAATMPIYLTGTILVPVDTDTTVTFTSLGYIPLVAIIDTGTNLIMYNRGMASATPAFIIDNFLEFKVSTTQIGIRQGYSKFTGIDETDSNGRTFRYIVFRLNV